MTSDITAPDAPSVSGTRPATRPPAGGTTSRAPRNPLRRLAGGLGTALLCLGTLLFVLPFLFTVVTSLRTAADVARSPLGIPQSLTLKNFSDAFSQIHYGSSTLNTLLITGLSCVAVTVIGSLAAYPLARITQHWSTAVYRLFILGTSVPVFVVVAPLYLLMRDLNLLDTYTGVVLIYIALNLPVAVFFYTSFIRSIPADLEEAAALDGCGAFRTFFTIILPLLRPVTSTLLTFVSLQIWNDLLVPLVFLQDPAKRTVMVNAYSFIDPHTVQPTTLFPAALLGVVPLLIIFAFFQRQVVAGMSAGAVKS
ncbi:carbohydrate ABC transporter membrane protein 2, CUT1 family (TC 3.A.1.1.-) [Streptomyces sp. yr375]|uniref:carbohydrate ABC transporter permease n=1 Tax=Streptomyces sp. yr375 TaxID=1761906 RepID=UPI0008B4801D|nr:carbohydrate ABC transporter permease [Streptomyces sp. yr375]SES27108.1 carbohydrate ABC transporter membrane protein 2, CUT1 family (TC 3.A.1.1.-) [Streptomyces sp. yr375]